MTVYHWTTKSNAESIMNEGLRAWSFVCADPFKWRGDVCLVIESLEIHVDEETWQGVTHRHVAPHEIVVRAKLQKC